MNAGLGNFDSLKKAVLPDALQDDTQFDAMLLGIGRGVARTFEQFCNRRFAFVEDDRAEFPANRSYLSLPRFPVTLISAIEMRDTAGQEWYSLGATSDAALNVAYPTGLVEFGYVLGPNFSRVRVTYTSGFWFETLEPTDDGYPGAMPDGATPLPDDLRDAWLEQSQFLFTERDALGQRSIKKTSRESTGDYRFAEIGMLEHVAATLRQYVRFST